MVTPRILVYLVPRLSQVLGLSVDTNSLAEPLLQNETPKLQAQIGQRLQSLQQKFYQPPHYVPPETAKVVKLKGIF